MAVVELDQGQGYRERRKRPRQRASAASFRASFISRMAL
jgi:hypothetical protein